VRTADNVISDSQDVTLLGLLVESDELTITGAGDQDETNLGSGLWVTHYLRLDGVMDLIGESQLVQKRYYSDQFSGSILDVDSSGYLERDQQGTANLYNYNYWGSPVGPQTLGSNNNPYMVGSVLHDGTISSNPKVIQWTSSYDATGSTDPDPITLSSNWIWAYENYPQNTYANWAFKGNNERQWSR
jgi:hypothetical protein